MVTGRVRLSSTVAVVMLLLPLLTAISYEEGVELAPVASAYRYQSPSCADDGPVLDDGVECCCRVHDADAVGLGMMSPAVAHSSSSNDSCSSDDWGTHSLDAANAVRPDGHAVQVVDPLLLAKDRGGQSTHANLVVYR